MSSADVSTSLDMTMGRRSLDMTMGRWSLDMTMGRQSLDMTMGRWSLDMTMGRQSLDIQTLHSRHDDRERQFRTSVHENSHFHGQKQYL